MFPDLPMNNEPEEIASDESGVLTITLLKQYIYCPRVAYYLTCLPHVRPRTYKMLAGEAAHEQERQRAARRTLFAYQVKDGERHFDVRLTSVKLGLTGIVDEVVLMKDGALVVDYKLAEWAGENHQVQLAAYALLTEEVFSVPVEQGYIYLMKTRSFESVPIIASFRISHQ